MAESHILLVAFGFSRVRAAFGFSRYVIQLVLSQDMLCPMLFAFPRGQIQILFVQFSVLCRAQNPVSLLQPVVKSPHVDWTTFCWSKHVVVQCCSSMFLIFSHWNHQFLWGRCWPWKNGPRPWKIWLSPLEVDRSVGRSWAKTCWKSPQIGNLSGDNVNWDMWQIYPQKSGA